MNVLKDLKAQYKAATGQDYVAGASNSAKPAQAPAAPSASSGAVTNSHTPDQQKLYDSVTAQGDKIRTLKSEKAAKVSSFIFIGYHHSYISIEVAIWEFFKDATA